MTDITDEAERRELRIYDAFKIERDGDKFRSVEEFLLAYDYFKAGYEAGAELARQDEREACEQECDRLRKLFIEERAHQMAVGAVECRDAIRARGSDK